MRRERTGRGGWSMWLGSEARRTPGSGPGTQRRHRFDGACVLEHVGLTDRPDPQDRLWVPARGRIKKCAIQVTVRGSSGGSEGGKKEGHPARCSCNMLGDGDQSRGRPVRRRGRRSSTGSWAARVRSLPADASNSIILAPCSKHRRAHPVERTESIMRVLCPNAALKKHHRAVLPSPPPYGTITEVHPHAESTVIPLSRPLLQPPRSGNRQLPVAPA